MAGNLTEENNVITARTYLENSGMSRLPEDYTEEELQKKFTRNMKVLREELDEFDEYRRELDEISKQQADAEKNYSDEELSHEYIYLNRSQLPIQKKYDTAKKYSDYLREYGNEFAQLYHIKDNNEKYGNPEKLDLIEVDITDNGDILTQDQYFKMRADKNERVKQLACILQMKMQGWSIISVCWNIISRICRRKLKCNFRLMKRRKRIWMMKN